MSNYGKELILDLHDCDTGSFNREGIDEFFLQLCGLIDMQQCERFFWDYDGLPNEYENAPEHLKGTTAVQFITTSNITIHTLDVLKKAYVNIFSCKDFDSMKAAQFCRDFFHCEIKKMVEIDRL